MPLIMMAGLPTSGKTTRANQLFDYFADRIAAAPPTAASPSFSGEKQQQQQQAQQQCSQPRYRLHLISDDTLSIPRSVYDLSPGQVAAHTRSANASEKDARAAVYAAVKRVLSDCDIVILDGLNYIKGWRYQLFCEAKAARTPSAVLQIGCPVDRARAINEGRLEAALGGGAEAGQERAERGGDGVADNTGEGYGRDSWENLVFRYEEPSGMSRWDSPLFVLTWDDDEAAARTTFARLWDAVAGEAKPVVRPNSVTVQRARDVGGDYLYLLERETQEVVRRVLEGVEGGGGAGGAVAIPRGGGGGRDRGDGAAAAATPRGRRSRGEPPEVGGEEEEEGSLVVEVPAGRAVGLPQLQRLRRTFVALNRGGIGLERVGSLSVDRVRESFVRYLNDHFEGGE